ncbi:MAG TPA: ABC transporter permease [Acidimicrobiia bacterium]|nr:ABC transporter permease [Acidimicrobiia bacterium]
METVRFYGSRLVGMIGVLLVLAFMVFCLQRFTPADPVRVKLGANAQPQIVKAERHRLGYDDPLPVQYFNYIKGIVHGDLQDSLRTRHPVTTDLGNTLPATLELTTFALVIALILALILGIASAARVRGAGALRVVLVAGSSAPVFLLALLGILLFYRKLHWLPSTGRTKYLDAPTGPTRFLTIDSLIHGRFDVFKDALQHLILPGLCIAIGPAVSIGRVLRSSIVTNLRSDYVRTARAKGMREWAVLWKHTVRNSLGAALSMTGLQVGLMFAGVVVIESIFAWPGIGFYTVQAIPRLDFPAIAGVTLFLGAAYVIINTAVEVLQGVADPRLRV